SAEWFGASFPATCPDGNAHVSGTDYSMLSKKLTAYGLPELHGLSHIEESRFPSDDVMFDLVEFSYETMAAPKAYEYHSYFRHDHFSFDQSSGRETFTNEVNRIFERCGIAYELKEGEITRLAPAILHEALERALFNTGDSALDALLETARHKFLNRSLDVRKE